MSDPNLISVEVALAALRAAGEATRLRLVALLAESELTVKDATEILGQSQPRISRHLKLLAEAGLVFRFPEGSWVYYRLADGPVADFARDLVKRIAVSDPLFAGDRERFQTIRKNKVEEAARYFAQKAVTWDQERTLHAADEEVEAKILSALGNTPFQNFLDLGTGTGRLLDLLSGLYVSGLGIDTSHDMLSVARANLERLSLSHAQVRQGDICALNVPPRSFDLVAVHQVLHYLDDPARVLAEAARALRPGGRLLIVDFAPHELEFLRESHAHRRLGFSHEQMKRWCEGIDLEIVQVADICPPQDQKTKLTVTIWLARDPGIVTDAPVLASNLEVA